MVESIIALLIGAITGFSTLWVTGASKPGEEPRVGLNALLFGGRIGGPCLHIHHWILAFIIIFITVLVVWLSQGRFNMPILFFIGFFIGAALEDLRYPDWWKIPQECPCPPPSV